MHRERDRGGGREGPLPVLVAGRCHRPERRVPGAEDRGKGAMIHRRLPRRTFLKGIGTAIALPALEAMLPASALAAPAATRKPLRLAFLFIPNGVNMEHWRPAAEGELAELPGTLEPLKNVKKKLTVLSGLTQDKA